MLRAGPLVLAALASLAVPPAARALPAFARRFNLACGACHIAVPRLNALPMLLGLHGGHAGHAGMHHDMGDMDGGMATMGEGLVGHGPMMMIGRVDPSTNFSYAVDRQIFHDVPADTSERGFLLRLGLQPYAFGAKFFGIFKRGDHTLLATEPTLYHAEAAPGVDVHGRLFASHLLDP